MRARPRQVSVELKASLDPADLARFRTLLRANRTVAAKALTFTAEKAQDAWRLENSRLFHLRAAGLQRGVGKTSATAGNLVATVGSRDKFFHRHVIGLGGGKKAEGGRLLLPTYDRIGDVRTHTAFRRLLTRMNGTRRGVFEITKGGDTFLARRLGKGREQLSILAVLRRQAQVKPRFDARGVVERSVRTSFGPIYSRLLIAWSKKG